MQDYVFLSLNNELILRRLTVWHILRCILWILKKQENLGFTVCTVIYFLLIVTLLYKTGCRFETFKHSIKLVGVEMVRSCWVQQQTTRPQYGILLRRSVTKASDSRLPSLKFNFIHETGMNQLLKVWLSLDLMKHLLRFISLKHLQNWVHNGTVRKYTW